MAEHDKIQFDLVKLLNGEKLEPVITLPTLLVTKDNAPKILKKNGLL